MTNPFFTNEDLTPPDLRLFVDKRIKEALTLYNFISLGTIETFDSENQTANVSINFLRSIKGGQSDGKSLLGTPIDRKLPYSVLIKVPIIILNGGGATLTFPISNGDTCLVFFCDKDFDNWFETGVIDIPNTERIHDISDGIALVGIYSLASSIESYYNGFQIKYNNAKIQIDSSGNINIISPGTVTIEGDTVSINP